MLEFEKQKLLEEYGEIREKYFLSIIDGQFKKYVGVSNIDYHLKRIADKLEVPFAVVKYARYAQFVDEDVTWFLDKNIPFHEKLFFNTEFEKFQEVLTDLNLFNRFNEYKMQMGRGLFNPTDDQVDAFLLGLKALQDRNEDCSYSSYYVERNWDTDGVDVIKDIEEAQEKFKNELWDDSRRR